MLSTGAVTSTSDINRYPEHEVGIAAVALVSAVARIPAGADEREAMNTTNRPLSPHIGVYRWRITSTLSILHRATGVALSLSTLLLVAWLLAAASGPEAYADVVRIIGSPLGMLILLGATYAFFFHLANGIRHLFWDAGMGFEMHQARASGWTVVALSILATLAVWAVVFTAYG